MSNNPVLEVKIENLHRELYELKEETKEDIKEINSNIKGNKKLFNKAIVTMTENITRLTTIADQQREEIRLIREAKASQGNNDKKFLQSTTKQLLLLFSMILLGALASLGISTQVVDMDCQHQTRQLF
ncbi:hypothetical protein C2W64_00250 [Brevibacillus laterosporus]|nr:hypothetical protein [Brevibacillus laterosporus]RAP31078.1 hypothetical protein C2W64_00250 [Brevibacillus laterosporus]